MPVCAKMISSWVRKVLGLAKASMSLGTLWGAVVSAAFAAGISLVSILQAGNWPEFLPQPDTIFQYTLLLQIGTRFLYSMLSLALVSSQLVGKCQKFTSIKSCGYVGMSGHTSTQCEGNTSLIFCTVLTVDSWNYFSEEQGLTAWQLLLSVCLRWLQWIRGSVPPCGKGS